MNNKDNISKNTSVALIFSKNRAMQLEALLRSLYDNCSDSSKLNIKVLFTADTELFLSQYFKLRTEFSSVDFIQQTDFKSNLLSIIDGHEYLMFLVDDNIFVREFSITKITDCLKEEPGALGFSLRLGVNTTYCYSMNKPQTLPVFKMKVNDSLLYDWTKSEYDFNYPLEVSSSVFRVSDLIPVLEKSNYINPNSLELVLDSVKKFYIQFRPLLFCAETSISFCVPINKVQTDIPNRTGSDNTYTPENLARLYENGERINISSLKRFVPNACHQEVELEFINKSDSIIVREAPLPFISVVIPCYKQAHFLADAVESIVNQTYTNWECIIVNDGSPDNTSQIAKDLISKYPGKKIHLIEKENGGLADARNTGINAAKGDWILPLDSDDKFLPRFMETTVDIIAGDKNINIVTTNLQQFGERTGEWILREFNEDRIQIENTFIYASLYKKELWEKTGGYYTGIPIMGIEDWNFWLSCAEVGIKSFLIEEKLFLYRIHSSDSMFETTTKKHWDEIMAIVRTLHPLFCSMELLLADHDKIGKAHNHLMPYVQSVVEKKPGLHQVYFWRGLLYEFSGDYKNALLDYLQAIKLSNLKDWQPLFRLKKLLLSHPELQNIVEDKSLDFNLSSNTENVFTKIYKGNSWNSGESYSGTGSTIEQTRVVRNLLPELVNKLNVRTFLDIPCGDFHWMSRTTLNVNNYFGADIVNDLVLLNSLRFSDEEKQFIKLDVISDRLPKCDMIFTRDCLVHLSFEDIKRAILNIKESRSEFILTTTFSNVKINKNIKTGDWRPINLEEPPFNFPAPLQLINEECTEDGGIYNDKCLGLWKINDLPDYEIQESQNELISEKLAPDRVLLICDYYWPSVGGVEVFVEELGMHLQMANYYVEIACRKLENRTKYEHNGMPIHEFNIRNKMSESELNVEVEKCRSLILNGNYKSVLVLSQPDNWIGASVNNLPAERPLIIVIPSISAVNLAEWGRNGLGSKMISLLKSADRVITVSENGYDNSFVSKADVSNVYIPHSVEQDAAQIDFRNEFGFDKNKPLLTVVSNFWPVKNHDELLDALYNAEGDWQIAIIGQKIDIEQEYYKKVESLANRDKRVKIIGSLDKPFAAAAIRDSDILLVPSKAESAGPLVVLQAMSYGTPWIATPSCNAVKDEAGGIIAPVKEFSKAIEFILCKAEIRNKLSSLGKDHWDKSFRWNKSLPLFISLIEGKIPSQSLKMPDYLRAQNDLIQNKYLNSNPLEEQKPDYDFSVIIPTYNRADVLEKCLIALSNQEFPSERFEVIVCDDGSIDNTSDIVRNLKVQYKLLYLKQENRGPAAARNMGIRRSTGKYLLIINDDAILEPDAIKIHYDLQEKHYGEKISILGTFKWYPKYTQSFLGYLATHSDILFNYSQMISGLLYNYNNFYTCNISILRKGAEDAGLFDETFNGPAAEDIEFGYRLELSGYNVLYEESCVAWHDHSVTIESFCKIHQTRGFGAVTLSFLQPKAYLLDYLDINILKQWKNEIETVSEQFKNLVKMMQKFESEKNDFKIQKIAKELLPSVKLLQNYYAKKGMLSNPLIEKIILRNSNASKIKSTPLVSVIIPCYNYARYLAEAVESIIGQTYKNIEIIVVNDGSTDNTKEVAEELIKKNPNNIIKLFNQSNSGQPAIARNNGIKNASGSFILPLDADDKLPADAIENYVQTALNANHDNVVVYGWMQRFGNNSDCWKTAPFEPNRLLRRTLIPSSSFFHRSVWEKNKGYALNVKGYEDWDFWISAAENHATFVHINNITSLYRETPVPSLQDLGRKNHELNIANIIINHPNLYEAEELQWSVKYLAEHSELTVKQSIHREDEQYPFAVSLIIINYPELYTQQEVDWAISFLKRSERQFLKGIQPNDLPLVTIISVNYNTKEWIKLLVDKVSEFTKIPYELLIIDNGSSDGSVEYLESRGDVHLIRTGANIGHDPALDYGFSFIRTRCAIVIDSDAHPIHHDWINTLISPLNNNCLISGVHHHRNYAHPACLALEVKTYYKYKLTFRPNWPKDNDISKLGVTNWDAGEYLSMKILEAGKKINLIPLSKRNSNSIIGSEYGGIVYHNFYATRLKTNEQKEFDGIKRENIEQYSWNHFGGLKSVGCETKAIMQEKKNNFRLSVIITTYNRIKLLEKVLIAFTNQTASKVQFELIVVDDGSSPKAEKCVSSFKDKLKIKYIFHENKGLAFSRNEGIENSGYEIIAFADDDDIPSPRYVEEHLSSHVKYPDANIAVLGKLEWDSSVQISPFMDYITRITGDYLSFDNLNPGQFYDAWKWWGGLISCKKELLIKYKPVFDERFTFGYEDTDLAIRMMADNIKILYNAEAKSYIIKKIEFDEYLNRKVKQGKSLFLLEQKRADIVKERYFTGTAYNEYEALTMKLDISKNKAEELEKALSKLPLSEQLPYLNNNSNISEILYKLYSFCIRGYLLKGYNESYRLSKIKFKINSGINRKLNIGLHAQTLYRPDNVVGGSEITTKGLKKAFERYENVNKVIRYGSHTNQDINEKLDLVIIEGWESDVPRFIEEVKRKNSEAIIFFWNLSFLGLENIIKLPIDGFLTNSDQIMDILKEYAPVKKILLAADIEELFPTNKLDKYVNDVVYLGMYHPHKSEEIISRMLIESTDFDFAIYGWGWDSHPLLKKYWKGKLPLGEIKNLYSSAKIVIGTTEDRQRKAGMINNRAFEALACGATFISEYFPELESTFGDFVLYSKQKGDTKKNISNILSNKIKRKDPIIISDFIAKNHTYDQRVKDILKFYSEIVSKKSKHAKNKSANQITNIKGQPFISICIPTYNRAQFLSEAIQSALNQKYKNFEILIVDDGSTDNTEEIVKRFDSHKIRYIKKENEGRPKTRNKLIQEAIGDYILWLDDDDLLPVDLLSEYSKILQKDPAIDIINGNLQMFDSTSGEKIQLLVPIDYSQNKKYILSNLVSGKGITFGGSLMKKNILEIYNGFNEEYLRAQDNELWSRICIKTKFYKTNSTVYHYRVHNGCVSFANFVDTSYESKTIRQILSSYSPEMIFPNNNYDEGFLSAAKALYQFRDYYNAYMTLKKSGAAISEKILELLFNCQVGMGNLTEAERVLELGEKNKINKDFILDLNNKLTIYRNIKGEINQLITEKDYVGLKNLIQEFVKKVGYNFDAAFTAGSVHLILGDKPQAFDYFRTALIFNPNDEQSFNTCLGLSSSEKEKEELLSMRRRLLESIPLFNEKQIDNNLVQPLISVIIPTYNRPEKLRRAVKSVLCQTYENYEILVVNDKGKDVTGVINEFNNNKVKLINSPVNKGSSAARNLGLKEAIGKYIAFLDDDDIFYSNHLQIAINNLNDLNKVIYTDAVRKTYSKDDEKYILKSITVPYSIDYDRNKLLIGNISAINCFVFEKSLIEKSGYFDESQSILVDWEFWLRLSAITDFKHVKENTVQVNWFNDGTTLTSSKTEESFITRNMIYKRYEVEISKIPNRDEIISEFNSIWQKDNPNDIPLVSIIVLSYNKTEYLKGFVDSVFKFTQLNFELIIIDNSSEKETIKFLESLLAHDNRVKVLFNSVNLGFPKGVNQGLKMATGKYIIIANNDIVVTQGWLDSMIKLAETNKHIGLVGPVSNSVSWYQLDKEAVYKTQEEMHEYAAKIKGKNKGDVLEFPRLAFLCTLLKREVIDKLGGLDERFSPGNYEDDDFCLRAQLAGYKAVIAKDVFIHHFGSLSFMSEGIGKYQERLDTNKKIFVEKWGADPEEIWLHGKQVKKRSIEIPLDNDEAVELVKRSQLYLQDKEYQRALECLEKVLSDNCLINRIPVRNLDPLFNLAGKLCFMLQLYEKAIEYYKRELQYNPESSRAYTGLCEIYTITGNQAEAAKTYEKASKRQEQEMLEESK
jgi:glycosyltransferase involved in cell wall biosynthesis